jgi:hypothetical protein
MDCLAENSYEAPYLVTLHPWATLRTAKLYAALYWATLYPTELHCILFLAPLYPLSYTEPSELHYTVWAALHPNKLRLYSIELEHTYWATLHYVEL